jgi:hypothetical protein
VAEYAGDTLWTVMAFWILALVRPATAGPTLGAAALAISWGVELSQLIRTPWLDVVRATTVGALALGQGFLGSDLICYSVGAALAVSAARLPARRQRSGNMASGHLLAVTAKALARNTGKAANEPTLDRRPLTGP